jgi:hypothetical protein
MYPELYYYPSYATETSKSPLDLLDNPLVGLGLGGLGLILALTVKKGIYSTMGIITSLAVLGYSGYRVMTGTTPRLI